MKLQVLGSSSKGNSYLLTDSENNRLLLECGIHHLEIKKALEFDLKNVWCCVTHGHQDHCKSISHLLKMGIKVFASKGTLEETNTIGHHNAKSMVPLDKYQIGAYMIMGFPVSHDTKEPFGFLIKHEESRLICFMTDTYYTKFKFKNVTTWITECNYDEEIIDTVGYGSTNTMVRNRVLTSHLSLQNAVEMFMANDLSSTKNIILCHLSETNSDAKKMVHTIKKTTGKMVHVAQPGLELNISINPF